MKLRKFAGYDDLTPEQKSKICNGAGAANDWRSAFIPNTLYGLNCTEVFNIHDYAYHVGHTLEEKELADMQMLINLLIFIEEGCWLLTFPRRVHAITYYTFVDSQGHDAFFK